MARAALAHCNKCNGDRNHSVLYHKKREVLADLEGAKQSEIYEVLQCRGCNTIAFRQRIVELRGPKKKTGREITNYYPPAVFRKEPNWLSAITDSTTRELLRQVYVASQSGINRLAAMGIRALIEHVMIKECEDQGSFAKNLDKFHALGHLSTIQKETIEVILEVGHATMHRDFNPSDQDVITLIDTVEIMLEQVYVQPARVAALKHRIPSRR